MKEKKQDILKILRETKKLKNVDEIAPLIEEFDKAIKELTRGQLGIRLTVKKK